MKKNYRIISVSERLPSIGNCLSGRAKKAGGFRWSFNETIDSMLVDEKCRAIMSINQNTNEIVEYKSIKEVSERLYRTKTHRE